MSFPIHKKGRRNKLYLFRYIINTIACTKVHKPCACFTQNLICIIRIARYILTQGINMKHLTELGVYLHTTRDQIDYEKLTSWIKKLRMGKIVRLEAALLVHFLGFKSEDIHFAKATINKETLRIAEDFLNTSSQQAADWYFTQGKNVFVGTSNSGAMMWHVRHSAKYMSYYPSEAVTNFFSNFAHSLSHIEE